MIEMTDISINDQKDKDLYLTKRGLYSLYIISLFIFGIGITLFLSTSIGYIAYNHLFWQSAIYHTASPEYLIMLSLMSFFRSLGLILAIFSIGLMAYSTAGLKSKEYEQKNLGLVLITLGMIFSIFFLALYLIYVGGISEANLAITVIGEIMFTMGIFFFLVGIVYIIKFNDQDEQVLLSSNKN